MLPIRTLRTAALILMLAVLVSPRPAESSSDDTVDHSQIHSWIEQLDARSFHRRESATEFLITAGAAAIEPVAKALPEGSLEVTSRGIHVLRELALTDDLKTGEQARDALEELTTEPGTFVARRAAETLVKLDAIRASRATAQLQRLGAQFQDGTYGINTGLGLLAVPTIIIDEQWKGDADDLIRLEWLRGVSQIVLDGPKVTDDYLKHVAKMDNLRGIIIKRANISDEGIAHLKPVPDVITIAVRYCPISDLSVEHLKVHRRATRLSFYGTQMTVDGADALQLALKETDIDHRLGAFLGVGCQPHEMGCEVARLERNTAAHKAGLRLKDVIVKYNNEKVTNFENLTRLIAMNMAGDKVSIEILRGREILTKEVTLGAWD